MSHAEGEPIPRRESSTVRNVLTELEQDERDIARAEGEGMCCWVNIPETKTITDGKSKSNEKPQAVGSR